MPHIIVEYAEESMRDQDISQLLNTIHRSVAGSGLFELSHVRTRAYPFTEFTNGEGHKPYLHVQARIKSGRGEDDKKRLSSSILSGIVELDLPVAVATVEIIDMDRDSYSKHTG